MGIGDRDCDYGCLDCGHWRQGLCLWLYRLWALETGVVTMGAEIEILETGVGTMGTEIMGIGDSGWDYGNRYYGYWRQGLGLWGQ